MAVADLRLEGLVHDLNNVFQTIAEERGIAASDPKWGRYRDAAPQRELRSPIVSSIVENSRSPTDLAPVIENAANFAATT